jgi:ubiquinone/menaquinone biosynthesis C-methylase UbiE
MAAASKGYKGIGMNGLIAVWYAQITQKNMDDFRREARQIAGWVPAHADILEIAPGPGYLSIELARLGGYHITGLDISPKFVEIAQAKAKEAGVNVDFRQGNASRMPFADNTFDFIVCRAAFKNFAQPVEALNEMHRVLRPGGKALIDDLRGDVSAEAIDRHVDQMGLNRINTFMTKAAFRSMLIKRAYTTRDFEEMASRSAFGRCRIDPNAIGLHVWLEK